MRRALTVVLLLAAIATACSMRLQQPKAHSLTGDEGITLLAATCHEREFLDTLSRRRAPYGRWVNASEWKRLVHPEHFLCLGTISRATVQRLLQR